MYIVLLSEVGYDVVATPARLLFQLAPVLSSSYEVEFPDDALNILPVLADEVSLPEKRKNVRRFRGGQISHKLPTVETTGDLSITFLLERQNKALNYLHEWYRNGYSKTLQVYLIETIQVIGPFPITKRLARYSMTDVQLYHLPGPTLVQGRHDVLRQRATFTVDDCKYFSI